MSNSTRSFTKSLRRFISGPGSDKDEDPEPYLLDWRSHKWFIILTVVLGIFVDIFLYGSTVVVLPFVLEEQAGVAVEDIAAWTGHSMLSYSLASLVSSPIAGFMADKADNRRGPLLLGLCFLLAGCICLWAANGLVVLLVGRVLQGVSAGFVWSIGLALIVDTVGLDEVGEVLAYADISLCFGLASAPPIAGIILQYASKDAVYGLILSMIILDVVMRLFLIERKTAERLDPCSKRPRTEKRDSKASAEEQEGEPKLDEAPQVAAVISQSVGSQEPDSSFWEYSLILFKSWRMLGALIGTWASAHIL
jgi:MFS family permease